MKITVYRITAENLSGSFKEVIEFTSFKDAMKEYKSMQLPNSYAKKIEKVETWI